MYGPLPFYRLWGWLHSISFLSYLCSIFIYFSISLPVYHLSIIFVALSRHDGEISSSLPPCGSKGLNSGCQAWIIVSLYSESSLWPTFSPSLLLSSIRSFICLIFPYVPFSLPPSSLFFPLFLHLSFILFVFLSTPFFLPIFLPSLWSGS